MKRSVFLVTLLSLFLIPSLAFTQNCNTDDGLPEKWVSDAMIHAPFPGYAGVPYFDSDTVYVLDGRIFIQNGEVLTVEEGTIIKGTVDVGPEGDEPSALIIARGGQAFMQGTADCPIIMTAYEDDVDDPFDLTLPVRGLWGGLIILGNDSINTDAQIGRIEGIPEEEEPERTKYGCGDGFPCDPADNSGIYQYISIRHGGFQIGMANEINGLTMGAVGTGTTIDHIEVFMNADDGFEFFGGSVNTSYLVSALNDDDSFDYDEGFDGFGQFWFSVSGRDKGDHGGEHDGGTNPENGVPLATPTIFNATYLGSGKLNQAQADQTHVFLIRDNAGGYYNNSVFLDFPFNGMKLEDVKDDNEDPTIFEPGTVTCGVAPDTISDTEQRARCGDLAFRSTFWWEIGSNPLTPACMTAVSQADAQQICPQMEAGLGWTCNPYGDHWVANYLFGGCDANWANNCIEDPGLVDYEYRTPGGKLDPRLKTTSPVREVNGAVLETESVGFVDVDYAGAFPETSRAALWTDGWTFLWWAEYTGFRGDAWMIGDADGNGIIEITDAVFLVNFVFVPGSPAPNPISVGDADCNGIVEITDAVYMVSYVFVPGSPEPGANCK